MTDLKNIRNASNEAFILETYSKAFQILWSAGVDEFILYGGKQIVKTKGRNYNWFTHPDAAKILWCDIFRDAFSMEY